MQSIFYKPFEKEFIHRLCITFKKVQNICPVFIMTPNSHFFTLLNKNASEKKIQLPETTLKNELFVVKSPYRSIPKYYLIYPISNKFNNLTHNTKYADKKYQQYYKILYTQFSFYASKQRVITMAITNKTLTNSHQMNQINNQTVNSNTNIMMTTNIDNKINNNGRIDKNINNSGGEFNNSSSNAHENNTNLESTLKSDDNNNKQIGSSSNIVTTINVWDESNDEGLPMDNSNNYDYDDDDDDCVDAYNRLDESITNDTTNYKFDENEIEGFENLFNLHNTKVRLDKKFIKNIAITFKNSNYAIAVIQIKKSNHASKNEKKWLLKKIVKSEDMVKKISKTGVKIPCIKMNDEFYLVHPKSDQYDVMVKKINDLLRHPDTNLDLISQLNLESDKSLDFDSEIKTNAIENIHEAILNKEIF
jgi:hypothetical protein